MGVEAEEDKEWRLERLELKYNTYGEDEGKYTGKIHFQNKNFEYFAFNIKPEHTHKFLRLIADEIAEEATVVSERMAKLALRVKADTERSDDG